MWTSNCRWSLREVMRLKTEPNGHNRILLPEVVGKGYGSFWRFKGRYRVCKGSRASKKSKTTALNHIVRMVQYPLANLLVVRKTFRSLKDSCFTELKWAIHRLGLDGYWKITESPLEMTYIPTGQKIYFRGLDDPLKVASITVDAGSLCWLWVEEGYEIAREADFDMLDESIRGQMPDGLFKQCTLTLNPWNEKHFIKKRFFDCDPSPDILAMTTNYLCNEWLDEADLRLFEEMKRRNPRRYRVAGLGEWGVAEGLIYENVREADFNIHAEAFQKMHPRLQSAFGLDFGYTNDPTALCAAYIDKSTKQIFIWDELYKKGLQNAAIATEIKRMGYAKERITGDSEDPKSIDYLNDKGLRIAGAKKAKGSVLAGIQEIQDYEIVVHPRCVHFLMEIGGYTWKTDKFGQMVNEPADNQDDHLMDAMRYGVQPHMDRGVTAQPPPKVGVVGSSYWR